MYKEHPAFDLSDCPQEMKVWRYLTFTKFVALLRNKSLFFSAPAFLGDPFEGSVTQTDQKNHWANRSREFREFAGPVGYESDGLYGDTDPLIEYRRATNDFERLVPDENAQHPPLNLTLVNCWHMNEYESAAMWSIYVRSGEGVAVQSTLQRLMRAFVASVTGDVHIGKVRYIDYDREEIGGTDVFSRLLTKRMSFSHERELRAISYPDWDPVIKSRKIGSKESSSGQNVDVDIDTLIEHVYLIPGAAGWLSTLISNVMADYGIDPGRLVASSQDERPLF